MRKVVLLKTEPKYQSGLERYAHRIASAFINKGADVSFLTDQSPQSPLPGVRYCSFPLSRWPGFLRLEQFDRHVSRWLQKHSADIVFGMDRNRMQTHIRAGNGVHAAYLKSRLASEGWIKYGLCQINPLHRKILELEREALENPGLRRIFVNSRMVHNDLVAHYSVDPSKIEIIHNGVAWKEYAIPFSSWEQERENILQRLALPKDALHLLFVGNGYQRKGLEPLLQALAVWKFKNFHLSVIGKEKNIGRYQSLVVRLRLNDRVRFLREQTEILPFYQMADVFIVPSHYDPFANVTLEALSFGLFVISSKSNGAHEILTRENGSVIENLASTESIVAALESAPQCPKTPKRAEKIRLSVSHLDFSNQLDRLVNACYADTV